MIDTIRSQAEIALLIFSPVVIAFVVFIKPIIGILYSDSFFPIEGMLYWSMSGTLFKAMAWSLSYSLLAKESARVFFFNEVISILYTFAFNMLGYRFFGLAGFGMTVLISYCIYFFQMHLMATKFFHFSFGRHLWVLFIVLNVFVMTSLIIKIMLPTTIGYVFGGLLLIVSTLYSLRLLDKKIGIKQSLTRKFNKNA